MSGSNLTTVTTLMRQLAQTENAAIGAGITNAGSIVAAISGITSAIQNLMPAQAHAFRGEGGTVSGTLYSETWSFTASHAGLVVVGTSFDNANGANTADSLIAIWSGAVDITSDLLAARSWTIFATTSVATGSNDIMVGYTPEGALTHPYFWRGLALYIPTP